MNAFQYPLDTKLLFRKRAKLKRELCEQKNLIKKKIAVLGGSTTHDIVNQLEIFLLYYGIQPEFYQSEYAQYLEDALFGNTTLDMFHPDIIYIHTNWRNIKKFPEMSHSADEVEQLLIEEYQKYESIWEILKSKFHCFIIQNNFERPGYRLLGNRDIWDYRGRSNYISRLNQKFYQYAMAHENFYINDIEYLSQEYGLADWENARHWYLYKYAMSMDAIPYVAQSIANIIKSLYGKNKKALVLDLDNTLWGGVVGDEGVEKIKMGPEMPKGQAYTEFQKYCKKLQEIGVLLAVNSKNDLQNALAGLNHPDCFLRPSDFVSIKANWNTKEQNLKEIAEELTLGVDSFVFVDDNPAERELISKQLLGVAVPEAERVEDFIRVIDNNGYFETTALSAEDMKKTEMYHAKAEAYKAIATFNNYDEYLQNLQMVATVDNFKELYFQRISQLINKTNQFNLTTRRCSINDIEMMSNSKNYICLCGKMVDKFGDNGIVTAVVGNIQERDLHIQLWVMSCRVLKRTMEEVMMNVLVSEGKKRDVDRIIGYFYPTLKNSMVRDFYETMGFNKREEDSQGNTVWILDIQNYQVKDSNIVVENLLD